MFGFGKKKFTHAQAVEAQDRIPVLLKAFGKHQSAQSASEVAAEAVKVALENQSQAKKTVKALGGVL